MLLEHKRKDFVEMQARARAAAGSRSPASRMRLRPSSPPQVHHTVTVALVGISYAYGWNRIGVIVSAAVARSRGARALGGDDEAPPRSLASLAPPRARALALARR